MMLFETRYFLAVLTANNPETAKKLKEIFDRSKTAYASAISIYEVFKISLAHEGRSVAKLRAATIEKDFTVVDVNAEIAEEAADIAHRLTVPMADALIMATSKRLRVPCVTDDPHFTEVKRMWV